jgi:hypothetical protein
MSLLHRMARKKASSYEILTFAASGTLDVVGNGTSTVSIAKVSGSSSWDSHAYVATPFTAPITIEFTKDAGNGDNGASYAMISLNEDPTSDASYSSLDYAAYPYQINTWRVYHNSTFVGDFGGTWSTTATNYIVYRTDGYLLHYNSTGNIYSVNWGAGRTVYIDTSFYSVNGTYSKFSNIRAIRKVWNGSAYV